MLAAPKRATNTKSPCAAARPKPSAASAESAASSRRPGSVHGPFIVVWVCPFVSEDPLTRRLRVRGAETPKLLGAPPHGFGFRACGGCRVCVPQFVRCQRGNDALLLAADEVWV